MPTKHRPLHLELMHDDHIDAFVTLHNILIHTYPAKELTMSERKLKPFDLQAALAGAKVMLQSGVTARVAAYNPGAIDGQQLLGWDNDNNMHNWSTDGTCDYFTLLSIIGMAPTKRTRTRTGWVNVYPDRHYDAMHRTQEEANHHASDTRIACVEVTYEWED